MKKHVVMVCAVFLIGLLLTGCSSTITSVPAKQKAGNTGNIAVQPTQLEDKDDSADGGILRPPVLPED